jgi:CubicO group peptidase (beta-lactamase class C family)
MNEVIDGVHLGLLGLRQAVIEQSLGLEGIHIARADRPPVSFRWAPDERGDIYSISKTFTSVAIGIAEAEGLLHADDTVLSHMPQFASTAAPGVEQVTLRHLLSMTAGIDYRWDGPDGDPAGDPAQEFLATKPGADPGSWFAYRGTNSYVLGRVIAAVSGENLRDFLMPRLFEPLSIPNPQWNRCPLGFPIGAIGLQLRTEEISQLGITLLQGGRYAGRQLIPAVYVDLMRQERTATGRQDHPDNQIYGLHCWHCARDGAWRMDGLYGQFSIMFPRQHACVTVTAHYEKPTTAILDAIWAELVPYL